MRNRFRTILIFILLALGSTELSFASIPNQERSKENEKGWDITKPRGKTRTIDFVTTEGTWMSVDVSPDGKWVLFDLLAHIYRLPITGGEAECLTQNSGIALNYQPRYSPDGKSIAFISDRTGMDNLWIMDSNGSNPHVVSPDLSSGFVEPAWTPDGDFIIVRQGRRGGFVMYHREGGRGVALPDLGTRSASWPCPSEDGEYLYFQYTANPEFGGGVRPGRRDFLGGAYQIRRLTLSTGDLLDITAGQEKLQEHHSSGGAAAPEISPDGRRLAFIRRIPDGTISYKGLELGPRTALWLRDLQTGTERIIMDPVEFDMVEGVKTLKVFPGYTWTPDARAIILSQGGRIRRLDVESGRVDTVPFKARVIRTISEQAYKAFRITDEPFQARFLRWHTASPDGSKLAFQAVGKIWVQDLPAGTLHRLTPEAFEPFEFAPAWSPDGRWIAFTSSDDRETGHLWKISAAGGEPVQLSKEPGEYVHPGWNSEGSELVVARGSGSTRRGGTITENPWFDLIRISAAGGAEKFVTSVDHEVGSWLTQLVRPSYGPGGRIFYPERSPRHEKGYTEFLSINPDGTDKRVHLAFPYAEDIVPSPDGKKIAFQEGDNIYVTAFPEAGTDGKTTLVSRKPGDLPVKALSKTGGLYPRWRNATTVEFGSGTTYFSYNTEKQEVSKIEILITIPRNIPKGVIALTNARIITLKDRQVIERGTIIIEGSRIRCVGDCSTDGADRIIDVEGKTIIPGFVDMHAHHHFEYAGMIPPRGWENAVNLAYGVTTDLEPYAWAQNVFTLAELEKAGKVMAPRTFSTGEGLGPFPVSPRVNELDSYEAAEQNIKRLKSWGATTIKEYAQPRRDVRQWIVDVARREGLMVTSEGQDLHHDLGMVMDGNTGVEHSLSYKPIYNDVAKFLGQAKFCYSPTKMGAGSGPWNEEYWWTDSKLWKDVKQRHWNPWRKFVPKNRRRILRPDSDYSHAFISQAMADIIDEGGYGVIGGHFQQNALSSQWEIWTLVPPFDPYGALEVASLHGAYFTGVQQDIGSIEVGKLADLIVMNSNPLDDIRNTADMLYVMKGGVLYEADTLDEIWPKQRPFGDYYWVDPDIYRDDTRPVDYWDKKK